jgi:sirohydrochlorin ferrochelatase
VPAAAPPLIAVAHGSRDPAAAAATRSLLAAVAAARPGLTVLPAFLDHERPGLADAVAAAEAASPAAPVVVPLLLGAAYHSRVDIPAALAGTTARQTDVLGPDPLLLRGLERRLAAVGVAAGDPSTAVVLAAAGTTDAAALDGVRRLAAGWRSAGWWDVRDAFASAAEPSVDEAVATLRSEGAPRVAVASYLLFPGLFAEKLAAAGADVTSAPLTDAPEVVELVLARYDAAARA